MARPIGWVIPEVGSIQCYERFEQVVALILANVIAVVIVISLFQLIRAVVILFVGEAFHLLAFPGLLGMIMTSHRHGI